MAARIYLFSYHSDVQDKELNCINERLSKLYDIKQVHPTVQLIKTDDDISILDKYLAACFNEKGSYFLVNITDQPNRFKNTDSADITYWMDNI
ncbi:hypothetical protein [Bacillus sp. FJAT-45037]|uniref:hypothetical protein n=1 Tax=Bacillus sp. FJAT-45037 TaxID=2011007 RepID=UPI001E2D7A61|nr:hypothetical protein [Bacillus sp. FJAT-45037]